MCVYILWHIIIHPILFVILQVTGYSKKDPRQSKTNTFIHWYQQLRRRRMRSGKVCWRPCETVRTWIRSLENPLESFSHLWDAQIAHITCRFRNWGTTIMKWCQMVFASFNLIALICFRFDLTTQFRRKWKCSSSYKKSQRMGCAVPSFALSARPQSQFIYIMWPQASLLTGFCMVFIMFQGLNVEHYDWLSLQVVCSEL